MKPLLLTVAVLLLAHSASLENTKDENIDPKTEHEGDQSQTREGRCTSCSASASLAIKSPNDVLSAIQSLPGAEVHSQSTFEGCSSEKGCAGVKVKDGQVVERYGNVDAFKAAAAADSANEFSFHSAGNLANVFKGGNNVPFWWMNENSPFKNAAAGGSFQKFSKSSSSTFSSGGSGSVGGAGSLDLAGNPFLNGDFSKGAAGQGFAVGSNPGASKFQSSSFESSSSFSSSNNGQIDLSNNPFLSGKLGAGFQAGGSKFGTQGFVGSTPGPFTASTAGSGINLIQGNQKNRFEYTQQAQGAGDAFGSGSLQSGFQSSGSDVACSAQNYECVAKSQCINGVINTNGVGIIQARGKVERIFNNIFEGERAFQPTESRWSPPPMDTRNPRGVTRALSAS
ncbi:hypothetical protein EVAR_82112_1 [Eumeta japonica]|uniref:PPAF-2-like Clip domain-containing protein n=1 Tax=Eumeta variegata TaxID=151549 RepID=A0A4C1U1S8_EUMVA|nr:hypothetical protein EVAR_82112_1 [Eumeta japonica]